MRHTLTVFMYELRRNFRRKGYLFTTFGVPVLALVAMIAFQRLSVNSQEALTDAMEEVDMSGVESAGYVDETGMFSDPSVVADQGFTLALYPDEPSAQTALNAGEVEVYYVIESDYMETGDVRVVMARLDVSKVSSDPIRQLILSTLTEGQDQEVITRILNPSRLTQTNLVISGSEETGTNEDSTFIIVYVFAIALLISLFVTNGYLMQSVIEEKETRLIEILLSSVRPMQLLVGKITAMGLLGLLQIVVWIGGMILSVRLVAGDGAANAVGILGTIANIRIPLEILPILLVYFILAYGLFAALYAIVGALSNSLREGPQYAALFTFPALLPLYFIPFFTDAPDGTLAVVLSLVPITSPLAMTQRLVVSAVPAWQIALSVGLLALLVVFVMWLAARVFRVQTLLAGQMPKLRDLPNLLR